MTLVIIPARMNSTRLPGKPMAMIGGLTLIERCFHQAVKAGFQPWVATDSEDIANLIGSSAVMTGECASGTDRVAAAAEIIDPEGCHEFVINYQGDMPFLDPEVLKDFVVFTEAVSDRIATGVCWSDVVVCNPFRRKRLLLHVGLYGFPRKMLRRFTALPQTKAEKKHSLEQERWPEENAGDWRVFALPSMPIEINTQADLDRARSCLM